MQPTVGARGQARRTVTASDTAESLGSGDVPVLGTPAVLALVEEAACAAIAGTLDDGRTTVGSWVELEHLAPSAVAADVIATAELTSAEGKILEFTCEVHDGDRVVARARHRRVVVNRETFLGRL